MLDSRLLKKFINDYENARIDGLCHIGAWEVALSQISKSELSPVVKQQLADYLDSVDN